MNWIIVNEARNMNGQIDALPFHKYNGIVHPLMFANIKPSKYNHHSSPALIQRGILIIS
jgi:hypothetical protein